jgi:molybdenum cofactor biosynthesis enzyme MoaA
VGRLFSRREWDLRGPLREGASNDELQALIRHAVDHKNSSTASANPASSAPAEP